MIQTREKWDSLSLSRVLVSMRYHVVSCFHFCFLFRTNCKKDYSDENYFPHCYGNFFELEKLQGTLTSAYLAAENFTDMDELMCQFFLGYTWNKIWWRYLENYQFHKNPSLYFEEFWIKIEMTFHLSLYASFSLKQT